MDNLDSGGGGAESFKRNLLDNYENVDIFFHTWWSKDLINEPYIKAPWATEQLILNEKNTIKELYKIYKPKLYSFSPSFPFNDNNIDEIYDLAHNNVKSMFFSLKNTNLLKQKYELKNNFKYDLVINARFDLNIRNFINLNEIVNQNQIHVGWNYDGREHDRSDYVIFYDTIFISNSVDSDKICSTYDKLELFKIFMKNKELFNNLEEFNRILNNFNNYGEKLNFMCEDLHSMNFLYENLSFRLVKNNNLIVNVIR